MSSLTLNVSLSPQLARFVHAKVESGLYSSASEVVREALRWYAERAGGTTGGTTANAPTLLDLQEQELDRDQAREAITRLRQLRAKTTLGPDLSIQDLRDDGRR
jgi:Arc/MetJ-type ribon-helix-helix transcriptional regulator